MASIGHIRDLPKSTLGVDIENGFAPHYINIRGKGDIIKQLRKDAKAANKVFLATDPDREGEAISWHLASELGIPLDSSCRVTFNELTKEVVKDAIKKPRKIDENLVDSQQARRILDRIVGYKLSPFLWKNIKSGLSAGRVQSVATRIIVDRENEIRNFVPDEYWTIDALLKTDIGEEVVAKYYGIGDRKTKIPDKETADKIKTAAEKDAFKVVSVKKTQKLRSPAPPFTTSTMQQEASRRLGFQSSRIMRVAQELYEGINVGSENGGVQGLITYMRTDSMRISNVAQAAAASLIEEKYGKEYLPKTPRVYKSKSNAQDAHEAIRPSNVHILPQNIKKYLTPDQFKLYSLIWERFVVSQMASAVLDTTLVTFDCSGYTFRSNGFVVKFPGFMKVTGISENEAKEDEEGSVLGKIPDMREKDTLVAAKVTAGQHFTEHPPRYNEASLVKFFEENGIGRPSTYATIITTIIERGYVRRDGKTLVPTPLGEAVTELMIGSFPDIVDCEFTAQMEDKLDSIENGKITTNEILTEFYDGFSRSLDRAYKDTEGKVIEIPAEVSDVVCEKCGAQMVYKNGRFGKFLACPNYPACRNTKAVDKNGNVVEKKEAELKLADFKCELCGGDVVIRNGRYGSFYACVNYPTCKFTKPKSEPLGVKCPMCGSEVIIKRGRNKTIFYSCEKYPECEFSSWDMPTSESCPDCGAMLYKQKGKKVLICKNAGCGYKRDEKN